MNAIEKLYFMNTGFLLVIEWSLQEHMRQFFKDESIVSN